MDVLTRLYEYWVSDANPQGGSCSNLSLGEGSYKSARATVGFVPSGVMVMHKVLLTAGSPKDMADAVLACKVKPA